MKISPVTFQRLQMAVILIVVAFAAHFGYRYFHPEWIIYRQAEREDDAKNWQGAIDLYEQAITLGVTNPQVMSKLGRAYGELKNYPKAVYWYQKYLIAKPNALWARKALAGMLTAAGEFDEAANQYKIIMEQQAKKASEKK